MHTGIHSTAHIHNRISDAKMLVLALDICMNASMHEGMHISNHERMIISTMNSHEQHNDSSRSIISTLFPFLNFASIEKNANWNV
jgi:hypothetical protein